MTTITLPLLTYTPGFTLPATTTHPGVSTSASVVFSSGIPISTETATSSERTVYETVYTTFCPRCESGLGPKTYTITQNCHGEPCNLCRPTGTVLPPGFTTSACVCEECEGGPITATLTVPSCQTYETAYEAFCSTGLEQNTYTITESCLGDCCPTPTPGQLPPGFTTTVSVCSSCGPSPITATLTVPTCEATAVEPAPGYSATGVAEQTGSEACPTCAAETEGLPVAAGAARSPLTSLPPATGFFVLCMSWVVWRRMF